MPVSRRRSRRALHTLYSTDLFFLLSGDAFTYSLIPAYLRIALTCPRACMRAVKSVFFLNELAADRVNRLDIDYSFRRIVAGAGLITGRRPIHIYLYARGNRVP